MGSSQKQSKAVFILFGKKPLKDLTMERKRVEEFEESHM